MAESNVIHEAGCGPAVNNQIFCSRDEYSHEETRSCPFPFQALGKECYYFGKNPLKNWQNARSHCLGLGGDLATPRHPYKLYSYILDNFASPAHEWWVGASLNHQRSGFEYITTNEPLRSEDWHPTLPHARPGQDCAYIHPHNQRPWANFPCTNVERFICQYP
ncbi:hypothetical protein Pcinc_024146 [Petrolisthes cinctipes]|uniref:C-type lectin domain-containing protein n=1 Tax=Petrolisthes cinctipes TaxID=88211 RepID=A0AAE1FB57_PETCI|nr:hypothetical protein Pcinc_024146 [Petrolisthes cinctipes]